ncbi:hypothetical protein [uncultured Treponema sp.]|uniref:hypothetical protein n=1 Tax=uncultured Treponema sp. TaxID=162155 RepID=UPI0025CDE68D|nr:hypothetical protein [uncultured Treponema sp.]
MAEDKSVFGRKVFFITPNITFEQQVIERLRLMEYEVYAIDDYRKAKPLLRKNANSICFCLIESQLTLKGWHNFIKSFEDESVFSPLDMGVIIHTLTDEKHASFVSGLQLDAGIIRQDQNQELMFHEIVKALDEKEAKGLRKYVRANCINEAQADLLWLKNNRMCKLKIIDISSVGIAAKLSTGQAASVAINQVIDGATINLRTMQIVVDIKITAIKTAGDFLLVVIMFNASTNPESINKIRAYIAENLQEEMQAQLKYKDLDRTDYELI